MQFPDDAEAIDYQRSDSGFFRRLMQQKSALIWLGGGKALITTAYNKTADTPNFDSVLAAYDISVTSGLVMDSDNTHYYQYPFYLLPDVKSATQTSKVDKYVFLPYAQALSNTGEHPDTLEWTRFADVFF